MAADGGSVAADGGSGGVSGLMGSSARRMSTLSSMRFGDSQSDGHGFADRVQGNKTRKANESTRAYGCRLSMDRWLTQTKARRAEMLMAGLWMPQSCLRRTSGIVTHGSEWGIVASWLEATEQSEGCVCGCADSWMHDR